MILSTVENTEAVLLNKTKKTLRWISNRSFLNMEIIHPLPYEDIRNVNTIWSEILDYVDFEVLFN